MRAHRSWRSHRSVNGHEIFALSIVIARWFMTTGKNINNEYSNDRKKYLTQNMISISISICKYILIQKDRDTYFNMEEYLYIHFLYSFKKVKGIQLNTTNFFCPHILKVDQFNTEGVLVHFVVRNYRKS
jgi:hypothetical protein